MSNLFKQILTEKENIDIDYKDACLIDMIIDNEKNKYLSNKIPDIKGIRNLYIDFYNKLILEHKIGNTILKDEMLKYAINKIKWKLQFYP